MPLRFLRFLIAIATLLAAPVSGYCQCDWQAGISPLAGVSPGGQLAITSFNDGTGLALYVADVPAAGDQLVTAGARVVRWDGVAWAPVPDPTLALASFQVRELCVFNPGGGSRLYAAGTGPTIIASWDGLQWTAVPTPPNGTIRTMAVFNDGSGAALYVGGDFTTTNGVITGRIARWNGVQWSAVGSGLNASVFDLHVHDDGNGAALYAGGAFTTAGSVIVNHVARWNGTSWSPLATGVDNDVLSLTSYDGGGGLQLIAGGRFLTASGQASQRVARWDGTSWQALGTGVPGEVTSLAAYSNGLTSLLYATGFSQGALGQWNGSFWSLVAGGAQALGEVERVVTHGTGAATRLIIGGSFKRAGGGAVAPVGASRIVQWDGLTFVSLGNCDVCAPVNTFTVFDDGTGPALFAGGERGLYHGKGMLAKWDGLRWTGPPQVPSETRINALEVYNDGTGARLFACGVFGAGLVVSKNILAWDGTAWSNVGPLVGLSSSGSSLARFDDGLGEMLYVGGTFNSAGGVPANHLARWNGSSWSSVGMGANGDVRAMAVWNDGAGDDLYVAGEFTSVGGGLSANNIARWDGTSWSALTTGLNNRAHTLQAWNPGTGSILCVGGEFNVVGGVSALNVARWNGVNFAPLGSGTGILFGGKVKGLAVFDDAFGEDLYMVGSFSASSGPGNRIARWDGTSWTPLSTGLSLGQNDARALATYNDGIRTALYAGGDFISAGPTVSAYIAKWGGGGCGQSFIEFRRGDPNEDLSVDMADVVTILELAFQGIPVNCPDAADINDDGKIDVSDPIYLLCWLLCPSPPAPPPAPGPTLCGPDPTGTDRLDCAPSTGCP